MPPRNRRYDSGSKYIVVSGGVDRDTAKNDIYANWRYTTGLGFGAEIPWGFSLYLDSSFYWTNYDGERWAVKNHKFTEIAERNFTQRYSISLSNNKIVPKVLNIPEPKTTVIGNRDFVKGLIHRGRRSHERSCS